ncbi:unnamed protein product [Albugo candida]|uniref:Uncharacterized protein n=1 Tax=Albugo candida TaxID=65357 RepID=A0A024GUP0_9STRA|nr:unnamed protein product [Albugo candida]|eukprot:CCI50497.1 unnamed protein product [Albugo candida]
MSGWISSRKKLPSILCNLHKPTYQSWLLGDFIQSLFRNILQPNSILFVGSFTAMCRDFKIPKVQKLIFKVLESIRQSFACSENKSDLFDELYCSNGISSLPHIVLKA